MGLRPFGKMSEEITSSLDSNSKTMMPALCYSCYIFRGYSKPTIVLCVPHLILVEVFSRLRKPKTRLVGGDSSVSSKVFVAKSFFFSLTAWNTNYMRDTGGIPALTAWEETQTIRKFIMTIYSSNSFRILCSALRLAAKQSDILVLEFPVQMPSSSACFQIPGWVNCIALPLLSQIVPN